MTVRHPIVCAICIAVSACTSMAPTYERPAAPIPADLPLASTEPTVDSLPWRSFILDPRLQQVVDLALTDSRSLRETVASIESARALYRIQRAALVPTVNAGIDASKSRNLVGSADAPHATAITQSHAAEASLSSYEVDLFGRVRSLSNAALETYLATEEASRATRISLVAETASAWFALASDRSRLGVAQATLASAERSMALTRKRLEAGVTSRVDLRQAETVYQQARADQAAYATLIAQDRNALELLVGHAVDASLLPDALPVDTASLADVPVGLSSSVLLQRPDVLEAEHQLKSANANIGAARAAFLPRLSLTASGGVASTALSSLFSGGAVWAIAPALSMPIFDGGANKANLAYSESERTRYVASYELAIQTAFREVADALARRATMQQQLDAQRALVDATQGSYTLANERYTRGVDTFLNALDSQRSLYAAQQTLIGTRLTAIDNAVSLYRVMGGGSI